MNALKELSPIARRMYIFFGILTLWTIGGPLLAFTSLMGGYRDNWPPENALEWFGFCLAVGGYCILMVCTLWLAAIQPKSKPYFPKGRKV